MLTGIFGVFFGVFGGSYLITFLEKFKTPEDKIVKRGAIISGLLFFVVLFFNIYLVSNAEIHRKSLQVVEVDARKFVYVDRKLVELTKDMMFYERYFVESKLEGNIWWIGYREIVGEK